ncbi:hypothetical protein PFISCL1PPCAC_1099, partial [Pristionchus fissidentatus]
IQDSTIQFFDALDLIAYSLSLIFFSVLLTIHYSIRYTFHPVFSFYFALIFLGYILCAIAIVSYVIVKFLAGENCGMLKILETINTVTYSYLLPLVFCLTLERLAATIFVKRYENMRPWSAVVISQIFCVS